MRKLVRDRIPELMGKKPVQIARGDNYRAYLSLKLQEEINELRQASIFDLNPAFPHNVKEEAADVITVVLALANAHGFCWEEIEEEIVRKGKEKGGFGAGFVMEVD